MPAGRSATEDIRRRKRCGGEFETLVVDGPHMDRRIELAYDTEWDGSRGTMQIDDAWLA